MQKTAQLRQKVIELTFENKQLEHYKQINQLILRGFNTLLTLDNKQEIFLQFFDLLKDAVHFSQASILQLANPQQVTVLASSLPVEQLTLTEQQQLLAFLPKMRPIFSMYVHLRYGKNTFLHAGHVVRHY